ncbi:MAG: MFS transporter [Clostridium sp.]|nr:MFS transporter [Clostridium sp.]
MEGNLSVEREKSFSSKREGQTKAENSMRVSWREKLCYGVGDVGANLVWTTVASFLTIYCTDVAGMAAGVIGTIMLIARLFDGVSDLFMGVIVDKTNTRWGKARPWVLWSAPPLVLSLIAVFTIPNSFSSNSKAVYLLIVYIFLAAVCFTASNLSYNTMLSFVTTEQYDRNVMNTVRFTFTMVAQLLINVATIPLVNYLGGGQIAWTKMSIIYAVLAMITFSITFLGTKERYKPIKKVESKPKTPVIKTLKILVKNKYFILITLAFAVIYTSLGLTGGSRIYFAKYVLGDENINSFMTIVNYVPTILGIVLVPLITKVVGKIKALFGGFVLFAIGLVLMIINPVNLMLVYAGLVFQGLGQAALYSCLFAIVGDVVDVIEWKTGVREEGLTYSVTSFGQKIGTGLGTAMLGWVLAFGQYDGLAQSQLPSALTAIKSLFIYFPMVLTILTLIIFYLFLGLDKVYPKAIKELQERRAKVEQNN